jgi:hypothetical protein
MLMVSVTGKEWCSLGHGSRLQRKVAKAYEERCTKLRGGWDGGVRRIDWLCGKTRLVGIEVENSVAGGVVAKLIFKKV